MLMNKQSMLLQVEHGFSRPSYKLFMGGSILFGPLELARMIERTSRRPEHRARYQPLRGKDILFKLIMKKGGNKKNVVE